MKQEIMFKKLNKVIKDTESLKFLIDTLIIRAKENKPVSDNPIIDGMNIAWLIKNKRFFSVMMFELGDIGHILDGTRQQIEQNIIWILNNEDKLCDIYNNAIKSLIKKELVWNNQ